MHALSPGPDGKQYAGWLDISGWQFAYDGSGRLKPGAKSPDWRRAVALGIAGISHRIGNGTSLDESFALGVENWLSLDLTDQLEYGAYWYAQPNVLKPQAAAELIAAWLAPWPELTMKLMIDVEQYYGPILTPTAMWKWCDDLLAHCERIFGHRPVMYWGHAFANPQSIGGSFATEFSSQPRYNRPGTPVPVNVAEWAVFPRWDRQPIANSVIGMWDSWQFSSDGKAQAYGCPIDGGTRVDCNIVLADRWAEMLLPEAPPPLPPQEDDMTTYLIRDLRLGGAVYDAKTLAPIGPELFAVMSSDATVKTVDQDHEPTTAAFLARIPPEMVRFYDDFAERPQ